jgi:hypothetical protein
VGGASRQDQEGNHTFTVGCATLADQHSQFVDAHGMEVQAVYVRRLLQSNFVVYATPGVLGANEIPSTYPLLVTEVQKLAQVAEQAYQFAEALAGSDGDSLREFDLVDFAEYFGLEPIPTMSLALACQEVDKLQLVERGR